MKTSVVADAPTVEEIPAKFSSQGRRKFNLREFAQAYALLGITIVIAAGFALYPETSATFTSAANMRILFGGNAVVAIVAFGMLMPLVAYQFDLSVAAIATLSSVSFAGALASGVPFIVAIAIGIAVALLIGLVNAVFVTKVEVDAVIVTLATSMIAAGIISFITQGRAITEGIPPAFINFGIGSFLGIPWAAIVWLAVAGVTYYILSHTPYGRYLYTLSSNSAAATLVGVRVRWVLGASFMIAALFGGVGGILSVAVSGTASSGLGNSILLQSFAAAFLSAAAIKPGRFNAGGAVVALLFLAVLNSGLNLMGVPPYVHSFVNGGALLLGVSLAVRLGGRSLFQTS